MICLRKTEKALIPYSLFDFANSSISLIIHAYLFPLYFKNHLLAGSKNGDAIWGALFSVSGIVAAVCAPFIGKVADGRGRYGVFFVLAWFSFITMLGLSLSIGTNVFLVSALFIVMNIAFYFASNMYDSLITLVASEASRARFSSFAWGFGYLGGVVCFAGVFFLQSKWGNASPIPYVFTAVFYLAFGAASVLLLKPHVSGRIRNTSIPLAQMLQALTKARIFLLIGYWLIADCLSTIIFFTAIYGSSQLKLSDQAIGGILLAVQLLAFPNTYLMSRLSEKIGLSRTLLVCVAIWLAVIAILVFNTHLYGLYALAFLTSLVIGSTQALMRAQYSLYLEPLRTSELFGWYAIITESSSILAPLLFGLVSVVFASQRLAMALLALPLVCGIIFVLRATSLLAKPKQEPPESATTL